MTKNIDFLNKGHLPTKRVIYTPTHYRVNKLKAIKTSNYGGGVNIFVKKRFLGFLWWVFVRDKFGNPIHFNKGYEANTFMRGIIKYDEKLLRVNDGLGSLKKQDDMDCVIERNEDVYFDLSRRFNLKHGELPEIDCVKRAWHLIGVYYEHEAMPIIELWHDIYKQTGKKIWLS